MTPLKILQVNTADIGGGAERVVEALHQEYKERGQKSSVAVGYKYSNKKDYYIFSSTSAKIWDVIWHSDRYLSRRYPIINRGRWPLYSEIRLLYHPCAVIDKIRGREHFHYSGTRTLIHNPREKPDILHCHNLHGDYFDLRALPDLDKECPVVLTLHDAWLLGGHCAHSFDCERWKTGCGNCPDLTIYPSIRRDATAHNWQRKAEIYRKSRLHVVTPCRWLMEKVDQSMLKPGIVASKVIPNGVDLKVFHPDDKTKAREELGLARDAKILLFAAYGIRKNIWKDYSTLRSALKEIAKTGKKVLCIALGETAPPELIGDVEVRFVPYQQEPGKIARFYQAADLYIHPARVDTFPNTILEALACGTPVVASEVGGIPEQVIQGETGFCVPVGDARALAGRTLELLMDEGLRQRMGQRAAEDAARRFGMERMAGDYLEFYHAIRKYGGNQPNL